MMPNFLSTLAFTKRIVVGSSRVMCVTFGELFRALAERGHSRESFSVTHIIAIHTSADLIIHCV